MDELHKHAPIRSGAYSNEYPGMPDERHGTWQPNEYLNQVAELERTNPEIRELGWQIREAMETDGEVDAATAAFNEAVERELGACDDGIGW